ncbi:MAG: RNA polymerase sigma-70 factor [Pedobacter sp.]|uniref:RNA polymerase sigma-70 factor n=1 Tax=Pedobacter sp. TaxID=1411316 RepID=UPI00356280B8
MNTQDEISDVDFFKLSVDNRQLKALFDEFYDRLVYFSVQMLRDQAAAEDIAQESFIKYWAQRGDISEEKHSIKNYLYSTVKNLSLNHIRHGKVVNQYVSKRQAEELEERSFIDALITAEVIAQVQSAIKSLPENYRVVSYLGFLEGKKNQEVADELGISINTVKKQKQRALQLLRLKLSADLFAVILWLSDYSDYSDF